MKSRESRFVHLRQNLSSKDGQEKGAGCKNIEGDTNIFGQTKMIQVVTNDVVTDKSAKLWNVENRYCFEIQLSQENVCESNNKTEYCEQNDKILEIFFLGTFYKNSN